MTQQMLINGRQVIVPTSEDHWKKLRTLDITSTESSALFGLSPYATGFSLWHQKRDGVVVELDANERMDWGNDLQDSIALSLGRRYGVRVVRVIEYMRIESSRMGSSFDFEIVDLLDVVAADTVLQDMFKKHGPGILEIKNVDRSIFHDKWVKRISDEDRANGLKAPIEPPGHIDIQLQHQLHVRERAWGAIGVLVGGNTGRLITRLRDEAVGKGLESRIVEFWRSVAECTEPEPFYPDDAATVAALYKTSVDRVFDGRGNAELEQALADYSKALICEKAAKEDKEVAKAKALRIIGDAERAYSDSFTISAKEVGPTHVEAFDRKGFRGWRVTAKKGKA